MSGPRILLIGINGQVGFELAGTLTAHGQLITTTRSGQGADHALDLADTQAIADLIEQIQPTHIVNAAAYTAVDQAEDEPELAAAINAQAPAQLARSAQALGAKLIHYSTDYVFDGQAQSPWTEGADTQPTGVYGQSKRQGEIAIENSGCDYLILRTSWVYAARGKNFVRTMLRLANTHDSLNVVADQHGSPTSARWIAQLTARALNLSGLYHLSCGGACSWYEFAQAIFDQAVERGLIDQAPTVNPISTAEYPTRARRPAYSVLDCRALENTLELAMLPWQRALQYCLAEMQE